MVCKICSTSFPRRRLLDWWALLTSLLILALIPAGDSNIGSTHQERGSSSGIASNENIVDSTIERVGCSINESANNPGDLEALAIQHLDLTTRAFKRLQEIENSTHFQQQQQQQLIASLEDLKNSTLLHQEQQLKLSTQILFRLTDLVSLLNETVSKLSDPGRVSEPDLDPDKPRDCAEVLATGRNESGQYRIFVGNDAFDVYCDMDTDGGGWTVFQRRQQYSGYFDRNWIDYKFGFGKVRFGHWLGNDRIHSLTAQKPNKLRVDLWDWDGDYRYAEYSRFTVASEDGYYRLLLGEYDGTAGDALGGQHNGTAFSTPDRDNDRAMGHCAQHHGSGWWYSACHDAHLNGRFEWGSGRSFSSIIWIPWRGDDYSYKKTEMKMRPV